MENKSFYAHHSAFGAFSSFILGKIGQGGGFVLSDVRPPENDIYIGYKQNGIISLMPFVNSVENRTEEEFTGEVGDKKVNKTIRAFEESEIQREMSWSSDTWTVDNFKFSLVTPFGYVKEPKDMDDMEKKLSLAPVIFAEITLDNTNKDSDAEMIFGIGGTNRQVSQTTNGKLLGGACERRFGFATEKSDDVRELTRLDVIGSWADGNYQNHALGRAVSLIFNVPAGEKRTYKIALGTYQQGIITTGVEGEFYYTKLFKSLEEVLSFGFENINYYTDLAETRNTELKESGLNEHKQFLIAHATHSYHASSELLIREDNSPLWILNEGEYIMINTFDLTVDHIFWEMKFHKWTVTNSLDLFVENYSYNDESGLAFTHDMGAYNAFSPTGYSSYELPNLKGCFSYMTHEELLNWIITGAVYGLKTKDMEWLGNNLNIFEQCLHSLVNRDKNKDGIMDVDSERCESGWEITTYDSLDTSLGQSRNNLYLGVKSWSAYVLLNDLFNKFGNEDLATKALEKAKEVANTVVSKFDEENQYIPAVFENGNQSRIIPAVEGLIYPYIVGNLDAVSENGTFGELITALKKHTKTILKPGCCIDEVSGGWKLSSTTKNTWNSKIFLCQYIITDILKFDLGNEEFNYDKAHALWQQVSCDVECATDQVNSDTGTARGSRLYPRLVTNILWMNK